MHRDPGAPHFSYFAPPHDVQEHIDPVIEKLLTDTQTAALLTAVTASTVNAMRQPGVLQAPDELKRYLPNPHGILLSMRVLERQGVVPSAAASASATLFAALDPALSDMEHYFADASLIGVDRAAAVHQFSLATAWRHAAHMAGQSVKELDHLDLEAVPQYFQLSSGILVRLLTAASMGESPCLLPDGHPYLPALPQRRQASRRILGQPATIVTAGATRRVFVRDVSLGGLGLEQTGLLPIGEIAVVTLAIGRRLIGRVVWNEGQRAGINLTVPLTPNDPLLWG